MGVQWYGNKKYNVHNNNIHDTRILQFSGSQLGAGDKIEIVICIRRYRMRLRIQLVVQILYIMHDKRSVIKKKKILPGLFK